MCRPLLASPLLAAIIAVLGCGDDASERDPVPTSTVGTTVSVDTGDPATTGPPASTDSASGAGPTDGDATAGADAESSGGPNVCPPLPDPAPPWLQPMQDEIVARLAGAMPIAPGVTLPDRATAANRAATRDYLIEQLDTLGLGGQSHTYSETGTNVYAALPATIDTERTLVVGAHFDSVPNSPGANDNATGVAMVLALGRWLQTLPCRDVNVLLVLFDEEEIGLVGSNAYAAWLVTQPLDVLAVHTIDQMGWDADGDRALELERADEGLFEQYEAAEPVAPGTTPLVPTQTGFTDHVSFREYGFDAIGLTEEFVSGDTTPHYHLPSDTYPTVDLDYLASSTALLHVTIGQQVATPPG